MLLPRVVAAALAVRQLGSILPSDICQPQCRKYLSPARLRAAVVVNLELYLMYEKPRVEQTPGTSTRPLLV